MAWRRLGRFTITVHTEATPADDEWAKYMAQVCDHQPLEEQRALVISAGGGPGGKQRKMMVDALEGAKVPVAIITSSLVMRAAGTAVSWFNPYLEMFRPDDLQAALDYLDLSSWERTETPHTIHELQKKLGVEVAPSALRAHG